VILTMYGGGFATVPAYLADLFGTQHVGAIHGRLLTAWSVAGILGPVVVNYIREFQLARGVPAHQAYNFTMYVLAGMLLLGLLCNLLMRPVDSKHHMTEDQIATERAASPAGPVRSASATASNLTPANPGHSVLLVLVWAAVALPLAWGGWITLCRGRTPFGSSRLSLRFRTPDRESCRRR
jgi:MFS family permease